MYRQIHQLTCQRLVQTKLNHQAVKLIVGGTGYADWGNDGKGTYPADAPRAFGAENIPDSVKQYVLDPRLVGLKLKDSILGQTLETNAQTLLHHSYMLYGLKTVSQTLTLLVQQVNGTAVSSLKLMLLNTVLRRQASHLKVRSEVRWVLTP